MSERNWRATECCGTCKHWDIEYAKDAAGRVRANTVSACSVSIEDIKIPKCFPHLNAAPRARSFTGRDTTNCPLYSKRSPIL